VEDLIKDIQERTGLSADKVLEVVTMVTDYMKNVLPEDLVSQITSYLSDAAASPGDSAGDVVATAAEFATKAAETTAAAVGSVMSAVSDLIPSTDNE
jgi:oligoribonuclease (3'-5' exoribonuclease)